MFLNSSVDVLLTNVLQLKSPVMYTHFFSLSSLHKTSPSSSLKIM